MFRPKFQISPAIATILMKIEAAKQHINVLPITPRVLQSLRKSARLQSTHYSTMIEGNRLTQEQVEVTIQTLKPLPGRDRDQKEVLGYYVALEQVERWIAQKINITEKHIMMLHALVMSGGKTKVTPTPYRTGQNVIREGGTGTIVYLPPEAQDVPVLMKELVDWINHNRQKLPCPITAAIIHYQFATIHPYYDGNGRTARLLTTLVLHLYGYDLKGIYSLDEHYAKNLANYYEALTIGPSHNYYLGRAEADISSWIEYFCSGMLESFENIQRQAIKQTSIGAQDKSSALKKLSARQRMVLPLFDQQASITSNDVARMLAVSERTARDICQRWVAEDFLVILNPTKKSRAYGLAPEYQHTLE